VPLAHFQSKGKSYCWRKYLSVEKGPEVDVARHRPGFCVAWFRIGVTKNRSNGGTSRRAMVLTQPLPRTEAGGASVLWLLGDPDHDRRQAQPARPRSRLQLWRPWRRHRGRWFRFRPSPAVVARHRLLPARRVVARPLPSGVLEPHMAKPRHWRPMKSASILTGVGLSDTGVTTRFVQNRTLSLLAILDCAFANEGMRKDLRQTANQRDLPFKILFQNRVQR
jgi:hypothetical protein